MSAERPFPRPNPFRAACRGVRLGWSQERNFLVHAAATAAVIALGVWLQVDHREAALLALCVTGVWSAELFNTALERLARAVDRNENPHLRDALDLAAGAVLIFALGAVVVSLLILAAKLLPV